MTICPEFNNNIKKDNFTIVNSAVRLTESSELECHRYTMIWCVMSTMWLSGHCYKNVRSEFAVKAVTYFTPSNTNRQSPNVSTHLKDSTVKWQGYISKSFLNFYSIDCDLVFFFFFLEKYSIKSIAHYCAVWSVHWSWLIDCEKRTHLFWNRL